MLYKKLNGEEVVINLAAYGEDEVYEEVEYSVLRRCANRLTRNYADFVRTTYVEDAYPNALEDCLRIVVQFLRLAYAWDRAPVRERSIREYLEAGRYEMEQRRLRFCFFSPSDTGVYMYIYTNAYRESTIIAKVRIDTGEILQHLPWEEWEAFMTDADTRAHMCMETGARDNLVRVKGNYGWRISLPDLTQWISREWIETHGYTVCPQCGAVQFEGYNCREVYDFHRGGFRVMCDCEYYNADGFWCESHERFEINTERYCVSGVSMCEEAHTALLENGEISTCDCCDEWFYTSDLRWYEGEDEDEEEQQLCNHCYNNLTRNTIPWRNPRGRMRHWSKPRVVFYGVDESGAIRKQDAADAPYYIGVELELDQAHRCERSIEDADELANDVMRHFRGSVYCEDDSSLRTGCECVSMPHTVDAYHAFDWDFLLASAEEHNLKDNHTCGMHTHVSRTAFGGTRRKQAENIAKLTMLIDTHWGWFWDLSRREDVDDEHWCKPSEFSEEWYEWLDEMNDAGNRVNDDDRYYAVNVQNSASVEIRLWASSTDKNTILGTIDTVAALVNLVNAENAYTLYNMTDSDLRAALVAHADRKESVEELFRSIGL